MGAAVNNHTTEGMTPLIIVSSSWTCEVCHRSSLFFIFVRNQNFFMVVDIPCNSGIKKQHGKLPNTNICLFIWWQKDWFDWHRCKSTLLSPLHFVRSARLPDICSPKSSVIPKVNMLETFNWITEYLSACELGHLYVLMSLNLKSRLLLGKGNFVSSVNCMEICVS